MHGFSTLIVPSYQTQKCHLARQEYKSYLPVLMKVEHICRFEAETNAQGLLQKCSMWIDDVLSILFTVFSIIVWVWVCSSLPSYVLGIGTIFRGWWCPSTHERFCHVILHQKAKLRGPCAWESIVLQANRQFHKQALGSLGSEGGS